MSLFNQSFNKCGEQEILGCSDATGNPCVELGSNFLLPGKQTGGTQSLPCVFFLEHQLKCENSFTLCVTVNFDPFIRFRGQLEPIYGI